MRRCGACGKKFIKPIDLHEHLKKCSIAKDVLPSIKTHTELIKERADESIIKKINKLDK